MYSVIQVYRSSVTQYLLHSFFHPFHSTLSIFPFLSFQLFPFHPFISFLCIILILPFTSFYFFPLYPFNPSLSIFPSFPFHPFNFPLSIFLFLHIPLIHSFPVNPFIPFLSILLCLPYLCPFLSFTPSFSILIFFHSILATLSFHSLPFHPSTNIYFPSFHPSLRPPLYHPSTPSLPSFLHHVV